ncbi:DNA polymerase (family 10) [Chitinophaga ginsengisegetis]|uniref:DNA polymerase (Family 10) n=1 Tax=Chitinophaga ginsengisegetis TaxID=393003 RepID=A0A1T5NBW2_9BACT|nr:hypothetical protein [Chitinophaga ginsengisegetis]SKC97844.1 DNA polymerase (family 10) [Chitinophaga ginsengisegetis]
MKNMVKKIPEALSELLEIKGISTTNVMAIHEQLGINNINECNTAVASGQLANIKGLTAGKVENIRRALKLAKDTRVQLWDALLAAEEILRAVKQFPEVEKAALTGSLRRKKDTIGDIDMVLQVKAPLRKHLIYKISRLPSVTRIIAAGRERVSILLQNHMQVDIRLADQKNYAAALLYYTGPVWHNKWLENQAREKGFLFSPNGLSDLQTGKLIAVDTEEDIYGQLQMTCPDPELREDETNITTAAKHSLFSLVTFGQIKGDMQIHSNWSDGEESFERIAHYVLHVFPHYQYIVVTDHASDEKTIGSLQPENFAGQSAEIDRVNQYLGFNFIKKGIETDILEDGRLSLTDEQLKQFDWVIASIHSGFSHDNTDRIIKACENPYVHCIGHPSGRLIGARKPSPVNWNLIFERAAATGTAMEINARPNRLDLNDELVKTAIKNNVKLVIDTDAHTLPHFDFMQLGVWVARRAACGKHDILNTGSWEEIEKFKKNKVQLLKKG